MNDDHPAAGNVGPLVESLLEALLMALLLLPRKAILMALLGLKGSTAKLASK